MSRYYLMVSINSVRLKKKEKKKGGPKETERQQIKVIPCHLDSNCIIWIKDH
jgi:hypothetical protein